MRAYQHIDINVINEVFCGNKDLLNDLLQIFASQTPIFAEQLDSLYLSKDFVSLSKLAHKIKGSTSTLGISKLASTMKQLEESAKNEDRNNDSKEFINSFKTISQQAILELTEFIKR